MDEGYAIETKLPAFAGATLLHIASSISDENMIIFLIAKGSFIDCIDTTGLTPLMYAVKDDKWGNVEVLLHRGANAKKLTKFGMTLFDYVRGDHKEVELKLQYLKQYC